MKTRATALASLITAAGLAGGAAATAQAHPAHPLQHTSGHHTSQVALTRLHALLQTPSPVTHGRIGPDDTGQTQH